MIFTNEMPKEEWNDFVLRNGGSFLQSFEWSEFQQSLGRKIWKITNEDFQALIIQHKLPFGKNYLYCPRGPVTKYDENNWRSNLQNIIFKLKEVRPPEIKNSIFLRTDPETEDSEANRKILQDMGFKKAPKETQPKRTLLLDVAKSEEELLAQMHPKTRYNIKLAEKHGLRINVMTNDIVTFEEFWRLMQETVKRDKFQPHPKGYYFRMLNPNAKIQTSNQIQNTNFQNRLFVAEYQKKIIAAAIVNFFGSRATYLHGASDYEYRNLMAPYLLQREQIKESKRRGCVEYDFWGIDEKKWPGVTRFKKGFGGKEIEYVGAWDFIFQPFWYKIYQTYHTLK